MLLTGLLAGLLLSGGALLVWDRPSPPPIAIQLPPTALPALDPLLPAPASPTPAPVVVHVAGAVRQPGVYTLPAGARVVNALEAAGGLSPDADAVAVNQAEALWDGAQVYVPRLADGATPPVIGVSGESRAATVALPESGAGLINVNSATAEELETLPGIGPSKAQAIIANRPYASVDDLDRVPGIGPATLEQLRPLVTVQ
ncbi:MAG: ComEA family DNA-binding protein [Caldilineaceae bacterium]|nr:ComEA family DNA-binding protein [Caldilineaceae bacterium]